MLFSCVSKKRKDDVSKFGKFYHNTTAKFNGYYNANVLLTESINKLNEQHQDNYNKILEMYPYVASNNPKAVAEDLDKAIEKVTVVVALHRVSHWTDDCYLLMGKAQYIKQEYEDAEETLEFFREEFDPTIPESKKKKKKGVKTPRSKKGSKEALKKQKENKKEVADRQKERKKTKKEIDKERKRYNKEIRKKRKKRQKSKGKKRPATKKKTPEQTTPSPTEKKVEEEKQKAAEEEAAKKKEEEEAAAAKEEEESDDKPPSYFMKHRPAYQEGLLWLARTYIERENYFEAELTMNELQRDPYLFEDVKAQLVAVQAYFYIKQKRYSSAIPPLQKAVEMTKDRETKARFSYIIGQLLLAEGNAAQAEIAFQQAMKYSTSYEMEFSSQLNLIKNAWVTGKKSSKATIKELNQMTKDIKNEDYQDQIYYTLAEIALKDNDRPAAIENLRLSLATSTINQSQKVESYLTLAELYFEDQKYVEAKNYYDSTLMVLPQTDERQVKVTKLRDNLTDSAKNIVTIQDQNRL